MGTTIHRSNYNISSLSDTQSPKRSDSASAGKLSLSKMLTTAVGFMAAAQGFGVASAEPSGLAKGLVVPRDPLFRTHPQIASGRGLETLEGPLLGRRMLAAPTRPPKPTKPPKPTPPGGGTTGDAVSVTLNGCKADLVNGVVTTSGTCDGCEATPINDNTGVQITCGSATASLG